MMTKNEAREFIRLAHAPHTSTVPLSIYTLAAKTLSEPPAIAQSIRDVAVIWPDDMKDSYCKLCCSFLDHNEENIFLGFGVDPSNELWFQRRTFMLLVAEALE